MFLSGWTSNQWPVGLSIPLLPDTQRNICVWLLQPGLLLVAINESNLNLKKKRKERNSLQEQGENSKPLEDSQTLYISAV